MRMPPALAKLFAGTAIASTVAASPAPAASEDEDEGAAQPGANTRPAGVSEADAAKIRANAETAVSQAVTAERTRWNAVLTHETGEGDAKASILAQPLRAEAAMQLLADTDLEADKIIATVSKPAFAGVPAAPGATDRHSIAAATARERLRGEEHRPNTGPGANGGGAGGDGAGNDTDPAASVRAKTKATREARNRQTIAQMGGAQSATA